MTQLWPAGGVRLGTIALRRVKKGASGTDSIAQARAQPDPYVASECLGLESTQRRIEDKYKQESKVNEMMMRDSTWHQTSCRKQERQV